MTCALQRGQAHAERQRAHSAPRPSQTLARRLQAGGGALARRLHAAGAPRQELRLRDERRERGQRDRNLFVDVQASHLLPFWAKQLGPVPGAAAGRRAARAPPARPPGRPRPAAPPPARAAGAAGRRRPSPPWPPRAGAAARAAAPRLGRLPAVSGPTLEMQSSLPCEPDEHPQPLPRLLPWPMPFSARVGLGLGQGRRARHRGQARLQKHGGEEPRRGGVRLGKVGQAVAQQRQAQRLPQLLAQLRGRRAARTSD